MLTSFIFTVFGAALSVFIQTSIELWQGRGRRLLDGTWICAVQAVYYQTREWHIQEVSIRRTLLGIKVETKEGENKLQWELSARLVKKMFLVGTWRSRREGSVSGGYMSLQLSSNGKFMAGHDYGYINDVNSVHYGILLLGRTQDDLESAWKAMENSQRDLVSLDERVDF